MLQTEGWSGPTAGPVFRQGKAGYNLTHVSSGADKQRICVNTQLKSSKKQSELNACVPKRNAFERYAITCGVIAYHLVHFFSIWVNT